MVQPLLILRGLEKAFDGVTAVRGVGITLAAGGQRTLAGPVLGAAIVETVSEALRA
jgi:ABC-type branched-subunit amino acid transport system ATPase component